MSQNTCSRCGTKGEMEYGPDGLPYCSSCSFYALNGQCYKCRMYIPVNELQQYRGLLMCPYCIQDAREDQRKHDEPQNEKLHMDVLSYPEKCSRCNGDLTLGVYYWNGKHLCKRCMEDGQKEWEYIQGGPSKGGQIISATAVTQMREVKKKESLVSNILHTLGLKKNKKPEVVQLDPKDFSQNDNSSQTLTKPKQKMSSEISLAKPMADDVQKIEKIEIEKNSNSKSKYHPSEGVAIEGPIKEIHKLKLKPIKTKKSKTRK